MELTATRLESTNATRVIGAVEPTVSSVSIGAVAPVNCLVGGFVRTSKGPGIAQTLLTVLTQDCIGRAGIFCRNFLHSTAKALSVPSNDALKASTVAAELAERLTNTNQGGRFRVELWGGSWRKRNRCGCPSRASAHRRNAGGRGRKGEMDYSQVPFDEAAVAPKAAHH